MGKRPVYLICPAGSVLWLPLHRRDDYSGRSLSDVELSRLVKEWHDIGWAGVDDKLCAITPVYKKLLHDYLEDEEEDFDRATLD